MTPADFHCRVISLARTPDRLAAFRAANAHTRLQIDLHEGVDGRAAAGLARLDRNLTRRRLKWTDGAIGNAMSHRLLWEACVAVDTPFLVLEDDAILAPGFDAEFADLIDTVPVEWEVIYLGVNSDSTLDIDLGGGLDLVGSFSVSRPLPADIPQYLATGGGCRLFRLNHAFGLAAYLMSPRGARRALQTCFPLIDDVIRIRGIANPLAIGGLDGMLNRAYRSMAAYACLPFLAMSPNDQVQSETIRRGPG